jgi:ribosomal protein S19
MHAVHLDVHMGKEHCLVMVKTTFKDCYIMPNRVQAQFGVHEASQKSPLKLHLEVGLFSLVKKISHADNILLKIVAFEVFWGW